MPLAALPARKNIIPIGREAQMTNDKIHCLSTRLALKSAHFHGPHTLHFLVRTVPRLDVLLHRRVRARILKFRRQLDEGSRVAEDHLRSRLGKGSAAREGAPS